MFKQLFEGDLLALPVLGLLLFVAIFTTALVWVLRRGRSDHYQHMASLPLGHDADPEDTTPAEREDHR